MLFYAFGPTAGKLYQSMLGVEVSMRLLFFFSSAIIIIPMVPSIQNAQMVQQISYRLIQLKQGKVCLSNVKGLHYAISLATCAALIGTELPLALGTVFTFDKKNLTCRTYLDTDFNTCSFQNCNSCNSYKYESLEINDSRETTTTVSVLIPEASFSATLYGPEMSTTVTHNATAESLMDELSTNTEASSSSAELTSDEPNIMTTLGPDNPETSSSILTGAPETTTLVSTELPGDTTSMITTQSNAGREKS